jgi:hypothetical protein
MDERDAGWLSLDCSSGAHDHCAHRMGAGGGFNPRHLRVEFGTVLCRCPCHASCPLAGQDTVSSHDWDVYCSCPGAQRAREDHARRGVKPPPDFREVLRARRQSQEIRTAAIDAVRAGSAGKSRSEIHDLLIDEFRSRSLAIPPEPVIENIIDTITMPGGPLTALKLISNMGRMMSGAVDELREVFKGGERLKDPSGKVPYFVPPGRGSTEIEVILNEGAEHVLNATTGGMEQGARGTHLVPLRLHPTGSAEPGHDDGSPLAVQVDIQRIGTITREDSAAFRAALDAARRQHQALMVLGIYGRRSEDGSPRLVIFPGGPPSRHSN